MSTRVDELQNLLAPVVAALGFELWGIELAAHGRHTLLRIFIDGEEGITVDDCAAVSRQVSSTMDVNDPIHSGYTLEVSSPGWDRPLFTREQYQRYVGERLKARLAYPVGGKRNCSGRLVSVDDEGIEVEVTAEVQLKLPFSAIKKANLVVEKE